MNTQEWPRCIKSARQKRRLVKTDRDKQLIQLYKRRWALWLQRAQLPPVALAEPYQSGWMRFFVLRDDIKRGPKAEFYETLLAKINTVECHHDKSFKRKKRRKGRYIYKAKEQKLRELDLYDWYHSKPILTERERVCFIRVESYNVKARSLQVRYVFTEPWRYVLKIAPYIITHKKALDVDIEAELAYIADRIDSNYLEPRLNRLTRGRCFRCRDDFKEPAKYINKFKNIPKYAHKEAYLELET
ncbi:hypothetical protein [Mucilaginibacter psychrotolerans]|uniref:Uncharacterized protein n=1 Tax=Mucilaginibacter psychrotolerans TaxID=1524096 RepID=A0A4Y8SPM9_9SPHI|nr:hypothetical protein [Mucilaginibacter psychrotolerans]TFF40675.1 hypothetical protein E2R66_00380 [Mucilaginibacter psychrotolerans]